MGDSCIFWFWDIKCFFLGHNFGSRHARRSSKGSINAGDHLVSKKSFSQNFGQLDWRPGPVKVGKKNKNTPTLRAPPRRTPHPNQKIFFIRTKKTCCIRRGFEQLSSYSGWRVITKKVTAHLLARAVVNTLASGWFWWISQKNSSFRLPYQCPSFSANCARDLFNGSDGSASLVDCTRKKIFAWGVRVFCE